MVTTSEILSTLKMIDREKLDVRTITMGISLFGCVSDDENRLCEKVYDHITRTAKDLVRVGEDIEREFGVPIVNKRISITPAALISGGIKNPVKLARALDRAAKETGVNFIGGYSALVQKGMTAADRRLMGSIPEALAETNFLCSSVNVGSTRAGIDMDAVRMMGGIIKEAALRTAKQDGLGCAKLVVFCNAVEDNPFMAGAFHGVGEADVVVNVGVSGPGVVKKALEKIPELSFVKNDAAFYVFPKIKKEALKYALDKDFAFNLLTTKHILIVPGSGFSYENNDHFRIVMLPEAEILSEAVTKIGDFLQGK